MSSERMSILGLSIWLVLKIAIVVRYLYSTLRQIVKLFLYDHPVFS